MAFQFTGGVSGHIPAAIDLVIGYSREVDKFPLNSYVQIRPVKNKTDVYRQKTTEAAGRVLDNEENLWEDGGDHPEPNEGGERFRWLGYRTRRRAFPFKVGYEEKGEADFEVLAERQAENAQKAMTDRTFRVHQMLADDNNWEAANILDVTDIPGNDGTWDASTVLRQNIKRTLNFAFQRIQLETLSAVTQDMMRLVLNPVSAMRIGETQEIVDHIKGSPEAYSQVTGQTGKWSRYGLPNKLYGYEVVVEDSVRVRSRPGAANVDKRYVMDSGIGLFLTRQGALPGPEGSKASSFSSVSLFMKKEMEYMEKDDDWNKVIRGSIVEDYDVAMTATASSVKLVGLLT